MSGAADSSLAARRARRARWIVGGLVLLGALELWRAAAAYAPLAREAQWRALARDLAAWRAAAGRIVVWPSEPWLDPVLRHRLPELDHAFALGPVDLRGFDEVWIVGLDPRPALPPTARAELLGRALPVPVASRRAGPLWAHRLIWTDGRRELDALSDRAATDDPSALRLAITDADCARTGSGWRCRRERRDLGRIATRRVEIDGRARRCVGFDVEDGERIRLIAPEFRFGDRLALSFGAGDFNARLRNGSSARIELRRDGARLASEILDVDGGLVAITLPSAPGPGTLEVELLAGARGQLDALGRRQGPARWLCVEVRALGPAVAPAPEAPG